MSQRKRWKLFPVRLKRRNLIMEDTSGRIVAECWAKDIAELIARCVNAHDDLVAALNDAKDYCVAMESQAPGPFNQTPLSQIVAAIAKAKPV